MPVNDTDVIVTLPEYRQSVVEKAWNPWRALRARPHLEFARARLPERTGGAIYWPEDGWAAILIDPSVNRRDRRSLLAHELIHDEWGGGCSHEGMPETWRAVVCRHENYVQAEVARRLVPLDDLLSFCKSRAELGEGVELHDVSEEFDVSESVALTALHQLGV